MTKKLLFVVAILCVMTFAVMAADVSGKWTYEAPGRQGGNPTTVTITLKADGGAVTGTVSRPGQNGPMDVNISEGKVDGNTVTFKTSQDMRGTTRVTSYKGTLDGDTLKLEVTAPGRGGGDPVTTPFTAKRSTT
jgi:hypothetical protein